MSLASNNNTSFNNSNFRQSLPEQNEDESFTRFEIEDLGSGD
jgi:hypothetical protein